MDLLHKGWFTEFSPDDLEEIKKINNKEKNLNEECSNMMKMNGQDICGPWTGQAFSLAVDEILFSDKSKYQDVLVFKSKTYGNVLVLDGIIQTTDRDEFAYQEMLAHIPLFCHANPKNVLIIGGGDGAILREVVKHECVEKVVMCEIDEMVVNVAKKFLTNLSVAFSHPKLELHIGDGFEFLKNNKNKFDVIITDSSDPVGPAESLFSQKFYRLIKESLNEGGIFSCQAESPWLHLSLISQLILLFRQLFSSVSYAYSSVPTYPSGIIGYLVASNKQCDLTKPIRTITKTEANNMNLKYYNSQVHSASFTLPNFVQNILRI